MTTTTTTTVELGFATKTLINDGRLTNEQLKQTRNWKLEGVPQLTDEQIACFLLACDNDEELTRKTIIEHYKAKRNAPELFDGRNIDDEALQKQLGVLKFAAIPHRAEQDCAIVYHGIQDSSYWKFDPVSASKLLFMTVDACLHRNPPNGVIFLLDMKGLGLMHLTRMRFGFLRKFFHYTQEALPVKLKSVHVLNSVYFLDKLIKLVKPFMRKEIMEMLNFHSPRMNLDEFHQKYISKESLPRDYGGNLEDSLKLHHENTETLRNMREFFENEEQQRKVAFEESRN